MTPKEKKESLLNQVLSLNVYLDKDILSTIVRTPIELAKLNIIDTDDLIRLILKNDFDENKISFSDEKNIKFYQKLAEELEKELKK